MKLIPIVNHEDLPDMPSASNTDHDGRYYTEAEIDAFTIKFDSFANDIYVLDSASITLTAGTMTADAGVIGEGLIVNNNGINQEGLLLSGIGEVSDSRGGFIKIANQDFSPSFAHIYLNWNARLNFSNSAQSDFQGVGPAWINVVTGEIHSDDTITGVTIASTGAGVFGDSVTVNNNRNNPPSPLILLANDEIGGDVRSGNIAFEYSKTRGIIGYLYTNNGNKLVLDSTAQADDGGVGVAWIDFDDGSASFATGAFDIDGSGNITDVGSITSDNTITAEHFHSTDDAVIDDMLTVTGVAGFGIAPEANKALKIQGGSDFMELYQGADSKGWKMFGFDDQIGATVSWEINAVGTAVQRTTNDFNFIVGKSMIVKLGDTAGVRSFLIQDSGSVRQFLVNSNGEMTLGNLGQAEIKYASGLMSITANKVTSTDDMILIADVITMQDELRVNGITTVLDAIRFTQTDGAERIDSDADGTLDLYAGTSIDMHAKVEMQGNVITDLSGLHFNSATELTISSGAVTATQGHHSIDTEADAANDDLDTINGVNPGEIFLVLSKDSARTVRLRDNSVSGGNIFLKHQVESKSFSFTSPAGVGGTFYSAGFYNWSSTDANLTQASLSVTHSAANSASACHIGIVAGGAGVVDTGVVKITVSGTTIDDEGNRAGSQTVDLVADITTLSANDYVETTQKWIGTVTIALEIASGSPVNYNVDFNYGCSKYEDFGNQSFTINVLEVVGIAGANDSGFNLRLFHHSSAGWTYAATGFVPGGTVLANMNTDYSPEQNLVNGESFAYKRTDLNTSIDGSGSEGLVLEIATSGTKSIEIMDIHIGVHTAPNFSYMSRPEQHLIFMEHGGNLLEL